MARAKRKSKRVKSPNGAGSVIERGDGRWMARYTMTDPETGLPARKTLYGASEQEARAKLIDALAARNDGSATFTRGRGPTLEQYAERWLASKRARRRPKTIGVYELLLGHALPTLGRYRLTALEPRHIDGLLARKHRAGLAARSCNHIRAVLRTCLHAAMKDGYVTRNVAALADGLELTDSKEGQALTPEQARGLVELSLQDDQDGPLWLMAIATGCRQSELLGLRWSDVNMEQGLFTVERTLQRVNGAWLVQEPKTKRSTRTLPLPKIAIAALERQHRLQAAHKLRAKKWTSEFGDLVFAGATGAPIDGVSLTKRLQLKMKAAKLPKIRFHDLRHTTTSLQESQGVSDRTRMAYLGHSQIKTTQGYTHVFDEGLRAAADAMDRALTPA